MASKSVHIANFADALDDPEVFPGKFVDNRTVYEFPEVLSTNTRGATLVWTVQVALYDSDKNPAPIDEAYLEPGAGQLPNGMYAEITTVSYQVSAAGVRGKIRAGGKPTTVRAGKNIGKVNETNAITQALRDALGKYNAQLRRGRASGVATDDTNAADVAAAAQQPPPMLVKKIGDTKRATLTEEVFAKGITVQRKYNGVRVVVYLKAADDRVQIYSRSSGDYPGFDHIRGELLKPLQTAPPVPPDLMKAPEECGESPAPDPSLYGEVHLDGEIYLHGKPLRWISGQARREDDESTLNYQVFDCFFPAAKAAGHDMASVNRQKYLDLFFANAEQYGIPHIKRTENYKATSMAEVEAYRDQFLAEGFEGAVARKDCGVYRYGINNYHSDELVKVKPAYDDEFEVVGYKDGDKGKDVGAVLWICEVDSEHVKIAGDKTFSATPKDMTYPERYRIYRCLGETVDNFPEAVAKGGPKTLTRFERDFRGQPLTVEYESRSPKTGKPLQGKALTFRTYEGGPAGDPLRRLFDECPA